MTIILKRVELSNIRSHKHFVFEPKEEGLTSISGPNGSGKSSLVDSIAWCLFGTKPAGVSKVTAIIREGASLPKDKCFAQVTLQADDKVYKIERRLSKHGIVECDVSEQKTDGWTVVAGPAVSHTEPFLRRLIKMDEKGFLAAILIQQKQVDQLISATPKERGVVIERLTGISAVSQAATDAKQEYNSLKKAVKMSSVSETPLERLREEYAVTQKELGEKTASVSEKIAKSKTLRDSGVALKEMVEKETKKYEEQIASLEKMATLRATLKHLEEALEKTLKEKDLRKANLTKFGTEAQRHNLHAEFKALNDQVEGLTADKVRSEAKIGTLKGFLVDCETLVAHAGLNSPEDLKKELKSAESAVESLENEITETQASITSAKGLIKSISSAVAVLESKDGNCPTCLQKVSDVSAAVSRLKSDEKSCTMELEALTSQLSEKGGQLSATSDRRGVLSSALDAAEKIPTIKADLSTETDKFTEALNRIKSLNSEVAAFSKILANADRESELRQEYEALLKNAQQMSEKTKEIKKEIFSMEREAGEVISVNALDKLRKKLDEARIGYQKIAALISNERGEIKVLEERQRHMAEKIKSEEIAVQKHQDLLKSVEIAGHSAELLEEFKVNRLENSVPIIEAHASGLLSKFTEGKFTQLKLDGKFNASVVLADGTERSVGLLSGGELSAASIALRLAISIMLNGAAGQSLIILDEVLVSQDKARAELILNTIKETCRGQVILIAHNDVVSDTSDMTITL